MQLQLFRVMLVAFFLSASQLSAQEAGPTGLEKTFGLRSVTNPVDPNPTTQSADERLATLRKRMRECEKLIKENKFEEFHLRFVDPFFMARAAAGGKKTRTTREVIEQIVQEANATDDISRILLKSFDKVLKMEPQWMLDGRAASFISNHNSSHAEFWVYFEGRWRLSPET